MFKVKVMDVRGNGQWKNVSSCCKIFSAVDCEKWLMDVPPNEVVRNMSILILRSFFTFICPTVIRFLLLVIAYFMEDPGIYPGIGNLRY